MHLGVETKDPWDLVGSDNNELMMLPSMYIMGTLCHEEEGWGGWDLSHPGIVSTQGLPHTGGQPSSQQGLGHLSHPMGNGHEEGALEQGGSQLLVQGLHSSPWDPQQPCEGS